MSLDTGKGKEPGSKWTVKGTHQWQPEEALGTKFTEASQLLQPQFWQTKTYNPDPGVMSALILPSGCFLLTTLRKFKIKEELVKTQACLLLDSLL